MCIYGRWIYNKYSQKRIFVKCGKCDSCLQEKANKRVELIQMHSKLTGLVCLMITLTYANEYIPYICISELEKTCDNKTLNVYRDVRVRRRKNGTFKRWRELEVLDTIELKDNISLAGLTTIRKKLKDNTYRHIPDKVCVIYYPDVQNFFKRLRTNLKRFYNYETPLKFFICAEYGPESHRAHFHILLWCPYCDVAKIEKTTYASWPFCSRNRKKRGFEIARDASKYCASYVNCHDSVPLFLQTYFPPKSSRSSHLGYIDSIYNLQFIRNCVERQDFSVIITDSITQKQRVVTLPAHVIGRYFPKYKGHDRLTPFEETNVLSCFERYKDYEKTLSLYVRPDRSFEEGIFKVTDYERKCDFETFVRAVSLGYARYFRDLAGYTNYLDYALEYVRTWIAYESYKIKNSHKITADNHLNDCYTYLNLDEYPKLKNKSLGIYYYDGVITNPNFYPMNVEQTQKYAHYFFLRDKSKKLSDNLPCSIN